MVKNCDLGLENAALGLLPRAVFSRERVEKTDPRSADYPLTLLRGLPHVLLRGLPCGLPPRTTLNNQPNFTFTEEETQACSVAVVSSVVVMSSHIITKRMRFYFFQSKCVVIVSSGCQFPTRRGMQSNSVKRSLRFPRSKFENFMDYP